MNLSPRIATLAAAVAAVVLVPAGAEAQRPCVVATVEVQPADAQVRVGGTYQFLGAAYDRTGNPCDEPPTFTWNSTAPSFVTVDRDGNATGVAVGVSIVEASTGTGARRRVGRATVVVTASGPNVTSQTIPGVIPVANRPTGPGYAAFDRQGDGTGVADALVMDPLRVQLVRGESRALSYNAVREDGSAASRVPITFTVEPGGERIVMVDSFGLITSLGDTGTATVRATVPGQQRIPPKLIRVEVRRDDVLFTPAELSLSPGAVETLAVHIPSQERAANHVGLFQFSSSDPAVATVSPVHPYVTAVGSGTAQIRAQSSYHDLQVTVNVHRRVASLTLEPRDTMITLAIGGTATLRAVALGADGSPVVEAPRRWTPPDSSIATFDAGTRTVTARRVGMTRVSVAVPVARDTVMNASLRIRVVAGGLAANRPRVGLAHGERAQIVVSLLDDSGQPIGPATGLTWTSSADSVAAMEGNTVVARRPGLAQLRATTEWDSSVTITVSVVGDMIVTAQREGRYDLYQLWPGGVRAITRDSAIESFASWSPDLLRIAYIRAPFGSADGELWIANADGSGATQVTRDSSSMRYLNWVRPGGQRLVFESGRSGSSQIWVINADGTGAQQISTGTLPNTMPAVSPDGQKVVHVGLRETSPQRRVYGIFEMNIDGSNPRELVQGGRVEQPQYTPDGQHILFLRDDGTQRNRVKRVYRLRIGQPADSAVAITPPGAFVSAYAQSADGQTLACTVLEMQGQTEVARVVMFSLGGTVFTPLTGLAPEERLSSPSLRPAPSAPAASPAGGTR